MKPAAGRSVLPSPYLLFLGDVAEAGYAKTAFGLRDWAPERCVGEWALPACTVTLGLPALSPARAREAGARAMVVGVANAGGVIAEAWLPCLLEALEAGLDLIGGLHQRLDDMPALREAAAMHGRRLIDVRVPPADIAVASGRRRSGKRLLTVGTDCALGKKYTALALVRGLRERGADATFRATGQTGILIAGAGVPMDAVVADFAAGAAEALSPDAAPAHWDVIEGQGSLLHPAYAGVSLALLHGSQPDAFVVCHDPGRSHMLGYPGYRVPDPDEVIGLTRRLGGRINPDIRCVGISLNTSRLQPDEALRACGEARDRFGLPAGDPMRAGSGFDAIVDRCLA